MADPNGKEAGLAYLEANKSKAGVITLASGLQYKILNEGGGMEHPTVSTPCDCHYAGRLLDDTQFDSSYDRGEPTTFAPNQVIKGWTEAMQLMVQGDKWELYVPMEMAYGASGKPPKIPAAATLIFIIEIVKIKGATVAKQMTYPVWTTEQLALWLDKDESACQAWRDGKSSAWEGGDEKLKEKYPTRPDIETWLDETCTNSKNKSLWKRTHAAKKPAAAPAGPPALTKETARELLTKVLDTVKIPANKEKLEALLKECEGGDPAQAGMMKMMKLMPAVQTMLGPALVAAGYKESDLMSVAMQIKAFDGADASIAADTAILMSAMQGDLSALLK